MFADKKCLKLLADFSGRRCRFGSVWQLRGDILMPVILISNIQARSKRVMDIGPCLKQKVLVVSDQKREAPKQ